MKSHHFDLSSCVALDEAPVGSFRHRKKSHSDTMASNVLLNLIQPDSSTSGNSGNGEQHFEEAYQFAQAVGSTLLNGLPLLGLDDWISLSDFLNENMNSDMRGRLMKYTALKGRFINLLGVRGLKLSFMPNNCWTRALVNHMNSTTRSFKVSF